MVRPYRWQCPNCDRMSWHEHNGNFVCPYCDPGGITAMLGGQEHNYRRVHVSEAEFSDLQKRLPENRGGAVVEPISEAHKKPRRRKYKSRRHPHTRDG